ncbi:hypothetical protein FHQ08_12200 [Lactobacillus sp. CC-MHH1034]|uniref:hypothetical protein n=1 Tax=Agrilactobacillus fermenti TaxID=2586909 RepID=UPI001E2CFE2E|nr:hypothetical protein [Agrilactobacillus fermenti]MCD2257448.1 hypothetical protein [Agrilactobacillus fermenti]
MKNIEINLITDTINLIEPTREKKTEYSHISEDQWANLYVNMSKNKILGLFYEYLSFYDNVSFVPDWFMNMSRLIYLNNLRRNKIFLKVLGILKKDKGFRLIKGSLLLDYDFEHLGSLQLKDIDLLICGKEVEKNIKETLLKNNFSQGTLDMANLKKPSRREVVLKEIFGDTLPSYRAVVENEIVQVDLQKNIEGKNDFINLKDCSSLKLMILSIFYSERNIHSILHGKGIVLLRYVELKWLLKKCQVDFNLLHKEFLSPEDVEAFKFVLQHFRFLFPNDEFSKNYREQVEDSHVFFNGEVVGKWLVDFKKRVNVNNYAKILRITDETKEKKFENFFVKELNNDD